MPRLSFLSWRLKKNPDILFLDFSPYLHDRAHEENPRNEAGPMFQRCLRQHDSIVFLDQIDVTDDVTVEPGTSARIEDIDPETGDLVLQLDKLVPELSHLRNVICLSADQTHLLRRKAKPLHGVRSLALMLTAAAFSAVIASIGISHIGNGSSSIVHRAAMHHRFNTPFRVLPTYTVKSPAPDHIAI